ncbi:MAG: UDP-N-acetylmuramoyl-L-alanine--D-glutamate ligase [Eggerthellaceae bacterium]|nr:UDP-N-acetylmuramoyl-L-alanine--D-glutamate ligase [Eggerthellaceae bacterium]
MVARDGFIAGFNHAPAHLGRVLILGLGKSGKAASSYCADLLGSRIDSLTIAAGARNDSACAFGRDMEQRGARVLFEYEHFEETYDLCIASPGISQFSDFYKSAQAASTEIVSEIEFAWRECPTECTWIAITGTNGKTTTTALTAHLLRSAGLSAAPVGNIGDVCLEAVAQRTAQYYVVEVSSYQLASTKLFAPKVAVLLNITPDHLSWHRSHEAYVEAKHKVLANLSKTEGAVAVLDATDETVRATVRALKATPEAERGFDYIPIGTAFGLRESMIARCGSKNAAYLSDDVLVVAFNGVEHVLCRAEDLQIKGPHNVSNALAAASSAVAIGLSDEAISEGLRTFAPLEHRIEPAGVVDGVSFYNDSKATNVDATLVAFNAFAPGSSIVLLGGRDKGTDLTPLVEAARANSAAVICFGEARERFVEAFRSDVPSDCTLDILEADHLRDAFDKACELAKPGQVVLLSPACASFDEFSCFEERGDVFKRFVKEHAARIAPNGDIEARQGGAV